MGPFASSPIVGSAAGRHSRRLLGGIVFALSAVFAAGAGAPWQYARTANFEVLSAASEKRTRQLAVELEQFRASFIGTFNLRPAHEPPVTVVLFDSKRQFQPYQPIYNGQPKELAGYFIGGADEAVIALNITPDVDEAEALDPAETILHEYVHFLLHTRGLRLPTWLNEGLAEFFSTFRVNGEFVEYGRPKHHYVDVLNRSSLMPLPRLMAINETSPDYNEEHRAGIFYAQSWALAHFLLSGEDRRNATRLSQFLAAIGSPATDPDAAFRETFGKDFDLLPQKLRTYIDGGRYYQRREPVVVKDLSSRITLRPATDFERDFALLNLRWRVHHPGDAMLAALQLAQSFPASPRPHELLAAIAATDGNPTRAFERWQQAAELRSEIPFVHVQAARAQLLDFGFAADLDRRLAADVVAQLRGWLDRASTANPHYDDLWETLALVEARAPEFRIPIVVALQQRVMQLKDPNPTLLALAMIRWRAKDLATASSLTAAVIESSRATPSTKKAAQFLQDRFSETAR